MSKMEKIYIERIQTILNCDEDDALITWDVMLDYFDPDLSEMTLEEFETTVLAANDFAPEVL